MSQSHPREPDHRAELDPLLAFNAELAAAESTRKPDDPPPSSAVPPSEDAALRLRLEQAERSLDRARIEISALKSDLATLVSAVDDIKKRLGRRPEPAVVLPPVRVPPRRHPLKVVGVALLCLTLGAAMWSLAPAEVIEVPQPVEPESSVELPVAEPATAVVPTTAVEPQTVATVAAAPVNSAREGARVAQDRPVQKQIERTPPRQDAYVGTLAIDAAPAGDVFINRRLVGRTPHRAENLRAGSHLIWIEREGYRRWTRVVAVAADRVNRVSAELAPLSP